MAIGDDAAAAGFPLVPESGEDGKVKYGAREINRTRDLIAQRTSTVQPISKGGTGATTTAAARTALGVPALAHSHSAADITSGTLTVARGGTGGTTAAAARSALGASAEGHTHAWSAITSKPSTFAPSAHTHSYDSLTGKPSSFPTTWGQVSGRPEIGTGDLAKPNAVPVYNGTSQLTTAEPTLGGHAANKTYCDRKVGAGGGTITGTLFMPNLAVVTSSYVAMYRNGDGRVGITPSAAKFKKNVTPKQYTLEQLRAVQVVNYQLRASVYGSGDAPTDVGVIAEHLIAAGMPEFVVFDDQGDPLSVHYERLALIALSIIPELAARIETLEAS